MFKTYTVFYFKVLLKQHLFTANKGFTINVMQGDVLSEPHPASIRGRRHKGKEFRQITVSTGSESPTFNQENASYSDHLPKLPDTKLFARNHSSTAKKLLLMLATILRNILLTDIPYL